MGALECIVRGWLPVAVDKWDEMAYRMLMTWSLFYAGARDHKDDLKPPVQLSVPPASYCEPLKAASRAALARRFA